jgi:hypothetical protein
MTVRYERLQLQPNAHILREYKEAKEARIKRHTGKYNRSQERQRRWRQMNPSVVAVDGVPVVG